MCEHIDKIMYINLNRRTDRRELIETQLNEYGLQYERFEAIETPGFGTLGCGLSHLEVLKIAKERGYKNILILEDDFYFLVTKEELNEQLNLFFDLSLNYDVCFLAYLLQDYKLVNNVVNQALECQTTSAYIVNNSYYDELIKLYEYTMPLLKETRQHWIYANDQAWKPLQKRDNWYYFIKRIGAQRDGISDTGSEGVYTVINNKW
jgi:glycosyl transferase family 25